MKVLTEQTNDNVNTENTDISITDKDIAETDGYDSDRYMEIDANDHHCRHGGTLPLPRLIFRLFLNHMAVHPILLVI